MKRVFFMISLLLLCHFTAAYAQIPETLTYQGALTDASGKALPDGSYNLTFKLYDAATGGTALWTEAQTVEVKSGVFDVILGSKTALSLAFDKQYWLGLAIGTGTELSPRTRLTATAYSMNARTISDNAVTANKIAVGQVVKSVNGLKDDVNLSAGNNVTIDKTGNTLKISAQGGTGSSGNGWTVAGDNVSANVSGNIGIGVSQPTHKLHVLAPDANVLFESTTNGALFRLGTNEGVDNWVEMLNRPGGNLAFVTGRMDQMVITRAGNFSLRPGVPPTRKLDVGGHLVLNTDASSPFEAGGELVLANGDPLSSPTWHIDHAGNGLRIFHQASINSTTPGTLALIATPEGKIGIGATVPDFRLDLNADNGVTQNVVRFGHVPGITNGFMIQKDAANNYAYVFNKGNVNVFGTTTTQALTIENKLGIGTPTPEFRLDLNADNGAVQNVVRFGHVPGITNGFFIQKAADNTNTYYFSNGNVTVEGTTSTKVLTITGGADLAEPFEVTDNQSIEPGSVVIIDEANPGQLKLSEKAYDTRVAGIISGAGGVNPGLTLSQEAQLGKGQNVALSGRVYAKATAANGAIKPGDLLTTSDVPGHAMKASEVELRNGAVLGKAMTTLETGEGLVLVLVCLQ